MSATTVSGSNFNKILEFAPGLSAAWASFTVVKSIILENVSEPENEIEELGKRCEALLKAVVATTSSAGVLPQPIEPHAEALTELLQDVTLWLKSNQGKRWPSKFLNFGLSQKLSKGFETRLQKISEDFQIALSLLNVESAWAREPQNALESIRGQLNRVLGLTLREWTVNSSDVIRGTKIDSGGYGTVFHGVWCRTPVALKVLLRQSTTTTDERLQNLFREVETWFHVRHTHVLPLFGVCLDNNEPFMISPLMRNGNALTYLRNNPSANRIRLLYETSLGILYLHRRGISHTDIKPENILVDDAGHALISDFGFAKVDNLEGTNTTMGNRPGTSLYMPPERLEGSGSTKEGDVYAFGITIWALWTLQMPYANEYPGANPTELYEKIVHENLRPDLAFLVDMPEALTELTKRCWNKEPAHRANFDEIADILDGLLEEPEAAST